MTKKVIMLILVPTSQKLVLVSATFLLVTKISKEKHVSLEWLPYSYYLLCFQKDTLGIKALIDLGSEVNAMIPTYASKLDLKIYPINIGAQKIDSSTLEIFGMILASF